MKTKKPTQPPPRIFHICIACGERLECAYHHDGDDTSSACEKCSDIRNHHPAVFDWVVKIVEQLREDIDRTREALADHQSRYKHEYENNGYIVDDLRDQIKMLKENVGYLERDSHNHDRE